MPARAQDPLPRSSCSPECLGPLPDARPRASRLGSQARWLPLVVLSAAAGLDAGGVAVLNSALPSLGARFGTSAQSLSWAVTGYALAFAGLLLCGGAMADRLRRRRVLVWGLGAVAAGGVFAFAASAFWMVVTGRVLQGAGAAATMPAATALLTSVYPSGPVRSRALGVFSSAQAACYGAGLVFGGVITSTLGWRWVFAVQTLVAVLTAVAARRWLPIGPAKVRHRLDLVEAGSLVGMITLVVLAADTAARPNGMPLVVVILAAAAASGYLWWHRGRQRGGDALLLDRELLGMPPVRTAAVVAVAFYFCVTGSLFLLPLYLQQVRGMSAAASGVAVLPVSLAVSGAALLSGRLTRVRGPRPWLVAGIVLTAGGVLLWCLAGAHSPYPGVVLGGLVVTGIGQGLAFPAITATGLDGVPAEAHGTASAVTVTALQVGSGIGPTVLAGTAQAVTVGGAGLSLTGYHVAYAVAAGVLLVVGIPSVARRRRAPRAGRFRGVRRGTARRVGTRP